jgi:hypothetical protein
MRELQREKPRDGVSAMFEMSVPNEREPAKHIADAQYRDEYMMNK